MVSKSSILTLWLTSRYQQDFLKVNNWLLQTSASRFQETNWGKSGCRATKLNNSECQHLRDLILHLEHFIYSLSPLSFFYVQLSFLLEKKNHLTEDSIFFYSQILEGGEYDCTEKFNHRTVELQNERRHQIFEGLPWKWNLWTANRSLCWCFSVRDWMAMASMCCSDLRRTVQAVSQKLGMMSYWSSTS